MQTWANFALEQPSLAEAGQHLIYQFGVGLGFLATVRKDGGPRLHPICPIVANGGLYAFILPSPKLNDLRRDGRFALHSFPPAENDDEFYVTGQVREISDQETRQVVNDSYHHEAGPGEVLFEFLLERCLLAKYEHRGAYPPTYTRWNSPEFR